jgi:hypothetical protein
MNILTHKYPHLSTNKLTYLHNSLIWAAENNFVIGSVVRIKEETHPEGWSNDWTAPMNKLVGGLALTVGSEVGTSLFQAYHHGEMVHNRLNKTFDPSLGIPCISFLPHYLRPINVRGKLPDTAALHGFSFPFSSLEIVSEDTRLNPDFYEKLEDFGPAIWDEYKQYSPNLNGKAAFIRHELYVHQGTEDIYVFSHFHEDFPQIAVCTTLDGETRNINYKKLIHEDSF